MKRAAATIIKICQRSGLCSDESESPRKYVCPSPLAQYSQQDRHTSTESAIPLILRGLEDKNILASDNDASNTGPHY